MRKAVVHREIGIDCGHRVPDHGSKCRSPHGHRYRIIATCAGDIIEETGTHSDGMVIDFGHIKMLMMDIFDAIFDHAFVIARHDRVMMEMYFPGENSSDVGLRYDQELETQLAVYGDVLKRGEMGRAIVLPRTCISEQDPEGLKVVPVNYTPTAENMARHMFDLLGGAIHNYYLNDQIELMNIRLYETPNGWVDFPGNVFQQEVSDN